MWSHMKSQLFQEFTFRMVPSVFLGAALSNVSLGGRKARGLEGRHSPTCNAEEAGVLQYLHATPPLTLLYEDVEEQQLLVDCISISSITTFNLL